MKKYRISILITLVLLVAACTGCTINLGTTVSVEKIEVVLPTEQKESITIVKEIPIVETIPGIRRIELDVQNIQQLPELPAGCEVTSTAMVLNYLGFDIDKTELVRHMPMMERPDENNRWAHPTEYFVGNPASNSYGCYSPVIVKTVESYLESINKTGSYDVIDKTGSSLQELYRNIYEGYPVIVWGTMGMDPSYEGNSWDTQDGTKFVWIAREHCMVLTGYDTEKNTIIISDPYDERGTVEYDEDLFETRFEELGKQAVIVKPKM